jgi:hypothetical protein
VTDLFRAVAAGLAYMCGVLLVAWMLCRAADGPRREKRWWRRAQKEMEAMDADRLARGIPAPTRPDPMLTERSPCRRMRR